MRVEFWIPVKDADVLVVVCSVLLKDSQLLLLLFNKSLTA